MRAVEAEGRALPTEAGGFEAAIHPEVLPTLGGRVCACVCKRCPPMQRVRFILHYEGKDSQVSPPCLRFCSLLASRRTLCHLGQLNRLIHSVDRRNPPTLSRANDIPLPFIPSSLLPHVILPKRIPSHVPVGILLSFRLKSLEGPGCAHQYDTPEFHTLRSAGQND